MEKKAAGSFYELVAKVDELFFYDQLIRATTTTTTTTATTATAATNQPG